MADNNNNSQLVGSDALQATLEKLKTQFDAVDGRSVHVTEQTLSASQKAQARTNIDVYGKSETYTKTEVNSLITTPNQGYVTVIATAQTTAATDVLPATGSADTIYRVSSWDGTQYTVTSYSEYAWDGTQYQFLDKKSQLDEVFDITVYNSNTKYANLTAALGTNGANVPQELRRGGMSVKFVQSSDNKYVEFRYMSSSTTSANFTNVANWQGVDDAPTAGSENLIKSGGVSKLIATNFFVGKGATYQYTTIKLMKKRTYRLVLDNPSYSRDNTGTTGDKYIFAIGSYNGNTVTQLVGVLRTNDTGILNNYYDFTVPQDSDYIQIGGRANVGIEVLFNIFDVTEIRSLEVEINPVINSLYSQKGYKGVTNGISTYNIVADKNWGISELIPVTIGTYTIICPSNIVDSNLIAILAYDTNKQMIDFFIEYSRTLNINSTIKYIALSVRYADADEFAIKDRNGIYLYKGGTGLYDKVEQLEESITNVDSAPTLESDNLVKSGGVFNAIAPLSANVVFKYDCYYNSAKKFISDSDWYVGSMVPVQPGDNVVIRVGSGVGDNSSQKIACMDANYNFYDYYSLSDRTITIPSSTPTMAYLALSVRKQDANSFKMYVNGILKYEGISDLSNNIPLINKRIEELEPKYDIYSKNRDKLDLLRGASMRNSRLQVLIATDTHEDWTALQNAVNYANQCPTIKAILALGDYGSSTAGKAVFERFKEIAESSVKPILSLVGNHDVGYDNKLRFVALADSHYNYITEPSVKFLSSGEYAEGRNYYYHDFTTEKVRVIMLYEFETAITVNNNDYWEPVSYDSEAESYQIGKEYTVGDVANFGLYTSNSFRCTQAHTSSGSNELTCNNNYYRYFSQAQMEWFVSTLNSTPTNYGVVICTHIPASSGKGNVIQRDKKFCEKRHNESDIYNFMVQDVLGIIVNAFTNGTSGSLSVTNTGGMPTYTLSYDFTNKNIGAKFMCFLSGHTHVDFIFKNTYSQYNIIPIFSDSTTRQYATKDVPTVIDDMEVARDALTAVAFDLDNDGVILTRVGTTATTEGYLRDTERLDLTQ